VVIGVVAAEVVDISVVIVVDVVVNSSDVDDEGIAVGC
jgi:hypothetical protein